MIDNKDPFDQKLSKLYQTRKSAVDVSDEVNLSVKRNIESIAQHGEIADKYKQFSFVKAALLMAVFVVVSVPLFSQLKQQIELINPAPVSASNTVELYAEELKDKVKTSHSLPEAPLSSKPEFTFTTIVADASELKLEQFNLQVAQQLRTANQDLQAQQDSLLASAVTQGRLIRQKDMWFIKFCDENRELLAMNGVDEFLLSVPDFSNVEEGSYFDLYSNNTGMLAMIESKETKQCD
ncbi:hypothetical protein [Thalassotalea crassostreae]|uniref:hypothetical protein n=1 Tax=Thalassotalea crassostreae TaxID=1763536 RepID=UPI000838F3F7|nr:hypothetical protein [Thalassotalea crassostreae]